jgi:hypothetical protein
MKDFDRKEAIESLYEEFEDNNEVIQEKVGLFTKTMLNHLSVIHKNKIEILDSLKFSPVIEFDPKNFISSRYSSGVIMSPWNRSTPITESKRTYYVEVFNIKEFNPNTIGDKITVELNELLMHPKNINEFKAGLEELIDEIALKTLNFGSGRKFYDFKYVD